MAHPAWIFDAKADVGIWRMILRGGASPAVMFGSRLAVFGELRSLTENGCQGPAVALPFGRGSGNAPRTTPARDASGRDCSTVVTARRRLTNAAAGNVIRRVHHQRETREKKNPSAQPVVRRDRV